MELQELIERINQWKLRQAGELPLIEEGASAALPSEDAVQDEVVQEAVESTVSESLEMVENEDTDTIIDTPDSTDELDVLEDDVELENSSENELIVESDNELLEETTQELDDLEEAEPEEVVAPPPPVPESNQ